MSEPVFMPHQNQALDLTESFNRCAYYLDMGLGKTFVGAEKMYLLNNPVNLVICQKSKIDDWIQHFTEFYPEYHVLNLTKKSEAITFRNELATMKMYHSPDLIGVVNYTLRDMDYDPYIMIYNKQLTKGNEPVRLLQRYVNNRKIFKTIKRFEDYNPKMG